MKHASLFSGIGGFDLAAEWIGWENVFQVEKDKHCNLVLENNFHNVKRYGAIEEFDGTEYRGAIDVLTGGPPCQPASLAGKRKGTKDNRWLWPEAIRVFGEIRPRFGVFENPDDLLTLEDGEPFERICSQMEDFGYKVETYGIPAACVEAWHERDRIWIVAYSNDLRKLQQERPIKDIGRWIDYGINPITTNPSSIGCNKMEQYDRTRTKRQRPIYKDLQCAFDESKTYRKKTKSGVVRMVHGIPNRVDRIKGLGNAIDPFVAYEIFKAIEIYNERTR